MINCFDYKSKFNDVQPAFEKLLNGLNTAKAGFDKNKVVLTEEQKKKFDSLQNVLAILADKNGANLPDRQIQDALDSLEKNIEFFHYKIGGKPLIDQFDLNREEQDEIDETLSDSFGISAKNRYVNLHNHMERLNPSFKHKEDEKTFILFKMALNLYRQSSPGDQDPGKNMSMNEQLDDGTTLTIPDLETAYRIMDKYHESIWGLKLKGAEGKNLRDLFKESGATQEEKDYLAELSDFCVNETDTIQTDIETVENDFKDALPDEVSGLMGEEGGEELLQGAFETFAKNSTMDEIGAIPSAQGQTAGKWLSDLRDTGFSQETTPEVVITRIMAVRILANINGKDTQSLNVQINEEQINEMAKQIKKTDAFSNWMDELKADKDAMRKALDGIKENRGAGLEEQFKKYLKNLPAGELHTVPPLDRYMPTALERIDILKEQVKKADKDPDMEIDKAKTVMEILAIRNAVHAHRGHKSSLKKPIPVRVDLANVTETLLEDDNLREIAESQEVTRQIKEGHGGLMCEKLLENYNKSGNTMIYSKAQVEADTVGGRMNLLRVQAAELVHNYKANMLTKGSVSQKELKEKLIGPGKEILKEYLALSGSLWDKKGHYKENKMGKHVDWPKMAKDVQSIEAGKLVEKLTDNLNEKTLLNSLTDLAGSDRKYYYPKSTGLLTKEQIDLMKVGDRQKQVQMEKQAEKDQYGLDFKVSKITKTEKTVVEEEGDLASEGGEEELDNSLTF